VQFSGREGKGDKIYLHWREGSYFAVGLELFLLP
jgi:hypothetical protein